MDGFKEKVDAFAARLSADLRARYVAEYGTAHPELVERASTVKVTYGAKYVRVDVDRSGRYMIPMPPAPDAVMILGIKGYGVPHRGHVYGTLDTVDAYEWGLYRAVRRTSGTAS